MELLYFYIEEYKNLSEIGFNLSNKERFVFVPKTGRLSRKSTPNYVDGFFGPSISHITGIIGANVQESRILLK